MTIAQTLRNRLLESYGAEPGIQLSDIVRNSCLYQNHLTNQHPGVGTPPSPEYLLMRQAARRVEGTIRRYFRECYAPTEEVPSRRFVAGGLVTQGVVHFSYIGTLDDFVVDVAFVSQSEFSGRKPAPRNLLETAAKAALLGKDAAILLLVDRSQMRWKAFLVENIAAGTSLLMEDIRVLNAWDDDDEHATGMSSLRGCRRCPVNSLCTQNTQEEPEPYAYRKLQTTPNPGILVDLDNYLYSLNDRPNLRPQECIHPSEFSFVECDRRIAYELLPIPRKEQISPRLRRIFDLGHAFHDVLQSLLSSGEEDFQEEVPVWHEATRLKGSCDGVSGVRGFEIKSISGKGFDKLSSPKRDHTIQATIYSAILKLKVVVYIYANKDTGQIADYETPLNKKAWHKIAARAERIVRMVREDKLPPKLKGKDSTCAECPFKWECRPDLMDRRGGLQ